MYLFLQAYIITKKLNMLIKKGYSLIRKYSNKQSKCIEVSVQLHPAVSTLNINSIWCQVLLYYQ